MTPEKAAIRRATLQAQRAVRSLDAAGLRELERAYEEAATDIRGQIDAAGGEAGVVQLASLRELLAQVEARLAAVAQARDEMLGEGLEKAARYGAMAAEGLESNAMAGAAVAVVSAAALRYVREFIAADGLQLSDRLWRVDRGAREAVTSVIERAVIEGHNAIEAARRFLARGEPVPAELARKMGAAAASPLGRDAAAQLTGKEGAMFQAHRVFRTEINRAHGEAYMLGGADHPDFAGWRFLLSPAHPEPDICDLLAAQNLYGLGPGVYPDRESLPWPAHPNTLSFVQIVFKDEIAEADRQGRETPMEALARLTPEARRGVLGKTKSELFDAGQLSQGMIRAPVAAVRAKISRMDTRDDLSKAHFNDRVKVDTGGQLFQLNGRDISEAEWGRLAGAVDGANVSVKVGEGLVQLSARHALYDGPVEVAIALVEGGAEILLDEAIMLKDSAPAGLGLRMFARQAFAARELGMAAIELEAAGSASSRFFNGYYTWARYGFDAELSTKEIALLPEPLAAARTVADLVSSAAGRTWWRDNGSARIMAFDLTPSSRAWETLNAVLEEKGVKL